MNKKIKISLIALTLCLVTTDVGAMAGRLRVAASCAIGQAKTMWDKAPQPVRKAVQVVVDNPIKSSVALAAASQAYLYAGVQSDFPQEALPTAPQEGALKRVFFHGKAQAFSDSERAVIKDILVRTGVSGCIIITVEELHAHPYPNMAVNSVSSVTTTDGKMSVADKAWVIKLDETVFDTIKTGVFFLRKPGSRAYLTDVEVVTLLHHEVGHIVLDHHQKDTDLDQKIDVVNSSVTAASTALGVGSFWQPSLLKRKISTAVCLVGLKLVLDQTGKLLLLLASRNAEYQADSATCNTSTLEELRGFKNYLSVTSELDGPPATFLEKLYKTHPQDSDRIKRISHAIEQRENEESSAGVK